MERRIDPLQRQSELMLLLLGHQGGLTREQIAEKVGGYPPDPESMRKQFHRDKEVLLSQGVPMRMHERDNEWFYEIREDEFYVTGLNLTWEEQLALELALQVVRVGAMNVEDAAFKLNAELDPNAGVLVTLPSEDTLPALHDARRQRAAVKFRYNDADRDVELWAVQFQNGRWYAVGWDHLRNDDRVFRVDRIDGAVELVRPGTVNVPEGFDPETVILDQLHLPGEEPTVVEVWLDALHAPVVLSGLGSDATSDVQPDGSVVVRFPISNWSAFRSWAFGLLDHARVLGPPELRDDVVSWLRATV